MFLLAHAHLCSHVQTSSLSRLASSRMVGEPFRPISSAIEIIFSYWSTENFVMCWSELKTMGRKQPLLRCESLRPPDRVAGRCCGKDGSHDYS